MYDAILFDLDGTLIDTERLFLDSSRIILRQMGVVEEVEAFLHRTVGIDTPTTIRLFEQTFPALDVPLFRARVEQMFAERLDQSVPMKSGAVEVLQGLAGQVQMGLVTSSFRAAAHKKLRLATLDRFFKAVVAREDVVLPKPAADPYLLAARQLGVDPKRCLVFEDSEPGVAAAHAAGMTVVQVPDIVPAQGTLAHFIAPDLYAGAAWAGLRLTAD